MNRANIRKIGPPILALGVLFMVIGFLQQGMRINFGSPILSVGFIFVLAGLVTLQAREKNHE